eukprot:1155545-Pelagomonas_calceolata.AAC.2
MIIWGLVKELNDSCHTYALKFLNSLVSSGIPVTMSLARSQARQPCRLRPHSELWSGAHSDQAFLVKEKERQIQACKRALCLEEQDNSQYKALHQTRKLHCIRAVRQAGLEHSWPKKRKERKEELNASQKAVCIKERFPN